MCVRARAALVGFARDGRLHGTAAVSQKNVPDLHVPDLCVPELPFTPKAFFFFISLNLHSHIFLPFFLFVLFRRLVF